MLLGALIKAAFRQQDAFLAEIAAQDPVLAARIRAAAARRGTSEGDYVAAALRDFLARNDGGEWTTVMGKLQDSDAPGMAFIDAVVRRRLDEDPA
jgi:hypothetical protein